MSHLALPTSTCLVNATLAQFLLEFGQEFAIQSWPANLKVRRGPLKECYKTVSDAAMPGCRWIYCESGSASALASFSRETVWRTTLG